MKYCLVVVSVFFPIAALAQSANVAPDGYALWDVATVTEATARLDRSLGDKALVFETIGNYDGHSVYLVLRGKTSRGEIHDTESDVQITVRGTATSVVGGILQNAEKLPRKQQRGTSIAGGVRRVLSAGDIMHIPPGTPHQLLIGPEESYLYILIKIDEEPLARSVRESE